MASDQIPPPHQMPSPEEGLDDNNVDELSDADVWAADEIELAYRRALDAIESVEQSESDVYCSGENADDTDDGSHDGHVIENPSAGDGHPSAMGSAPAGLPKGERPERDVPKTDRGESAHAAEVVASDNDRPYAGRSRGGMPPDGLFPSTPDVRSPVSGVTHEAVIEAILFVGGQPTTTKKLARLLGEGWDADRVDNAIESLNDRYRHECRPYEIRLGEGGHRMLLRDEFQKVRNRVFGLGPREVRLSQDALEILALVAYRQPITRPEIEAVCERIAGGSLRQLVRRELIAVEREVSDDGPARVCYRTTPRFLQLFGLTGLEELPRPDQLSFK